MAAQIDRVGWRADRKHVRRDPYWQRIAQQVTEGSSFFPGTSFMGFDLAEWLQTIWTAE